MPFRYPVLTASMDENVLAAGAHDNHLLSQPSSIREEAGDDKDSPSFPIFCWQSYGLLK